MILYMAVDTKGGYDLPLYVTENRKELAKKFNLSIGALNNYLYHKKMTGSHKGIQFLRVEVEDING